MLLTKKKKALAKNSAPQLIPGVYNSSITSVTFDERYDNFIGLRINYELTDKDGRTFEFDELFHNVPGNQRTEEFIQYLENSGIDTDDVQNLVGFTEILTLKWTVKHHRQYLTIVNRKTA